MFLPPFWRPFLSGGSVGWLYMWVGVYRRNICSKKDGGCAEWNEKKLDVCVCVLGSFSFTFLFPLFFLLPQEHLWGGMKGKQWVRNIGTANTIEQLSIFRWASLASLLSHLSHSHHPQYNPLDRGAQALYFIFNITISSTKSHQDHLPNQSHQLPTPLTLEIQLMP